MATPERQLGAENEGADYSLGAQLAAKGFSFNTLQIEPETPKEALPSAVKPETLLMTEPQPVQKIENEDEVVIKRRIVELKELKTQRLLSEDEKGELNAHYLQLEQIKKDQRAAAEKPPTAAQKETRSKAIKEVIEKVAPGVFGDKKDFAPIQEEMDAMFVEEIPNPVQPENKSATISETIMEPKFSSPEVSQGSINDHTAANDAFNPEVAAKTESTTQDPFAAAMSKRWEESSMERKAAGIGETAETLTLEGEQPKRPLQSAYDAAMERIQKENEEKRKAAEQEVWGENITLEPLATETAAVNEASTALATAQSTERGPVTIEGEFTRVPSEEEKRLAPINPEQEQPAGRTEALKWLEKQASLKALEQSVDARAEKAGVAKEKLLNVVKAWNEIPLTYRFLLSAGLIASGAFAGAAAAGTAAAIGTGIRFLGGAGFYLSTEQKLKESTEAKTGTERTKAEKIRHQTLAATITVLVAGFLPGVVRDYAVDHGVIEKLASLFGSTPVAAPTPSFEYVVSEGGTLWGGIEEQLNNQPAFAGLDDAQKTYAIDALKDKFAAMTPEQLQAIGISSGNIDAIQAGEHIDLAKVLGDTQFMNETMTQASGYTFAPEEAAVSETPAAEASTTATTEAVAQTTPAAPTPDAAHLTPASFEANAAPQAATVDFITNASAENMVHNQINDLFGSKGFLGFGVRDGIESAAWNSLSTQTIDQVTSAKPSFNGDKLLGLLTETQKETGVIPNAQEKVGEYLKRAAVTALSRTPNVTSI